MQENLTSFHLKCIIIFLYIHICSVHIKTHIVWYMSLLFRELIRTQQEVTLLILMMHFAGLAFSVAASPWTRKSLFVQPAMPTQISNFRCRFRLSFGYFVRFCMFYSEPISLFCGFVLCFLVYFLLFALSLAVSTVKSYYCLKRQARLSLK